jgi:hypothetical protein
LRRPEISIDELTPALVKLYPEFFERDGEVPSVPALRSVIPSRSVILSDSEGSAVPLVVENSVYENRGSVLPDSTGVILSKPGGVSEGSAVPDVESAETSSPQTPATAAENDLPFPPQAVQTSATNQGDIPPRSVILSASEGSAVPNAESIEPLSRTREPQDISNTRGVTPPRSVILSASEGSAVLPDAEPSPTDAPPHYSSDVRNELKSIETEIKYAGYLQQQEKAIERLKRAEERHIPEWFDYASVSGLSREMKEILLRVLPRTLGQASRIPGVTPAAVSLINVYIEIQDRRRDHPQRTF